LSTRERILRILDKHGFVPSAAGAALAGGRTGLIGVLVPSLTWAIMSPILHGVADVIEQTSCELVLYSLVHKHERGEIIQRIVDGRLIDGLIAAYPDGVASSAEVVDDDRRVSQHLSQLHEQGLPVVVIDDQAAHDDTPWISADNRQGAMEAVRHLIRLGHRRIAHISGPEPYLCSQDRREGYWSALEEAGLPFDRTLDVTGDFTSASGWAGAIFLLTLPEPPTAIFAANDDMAGGVLTAVRQHGLRVPEDVAVVGFDDAGPLASAQPSLSAARQPFFDMGWWAATTLMELIETPRLRPHGHLHGHPHSLLHSTTRQRHERAVQTPLHVVSSPNAPSRIQLPVELVQRSSSAAPDLAARMAR
jgi:LacI family transcriptional regulator